MLLPKVFAMINTYIIFASMIQYVITLSELFNILRDAVNTMIQLQIRVRLLRVLYLHRRIMIKTI